LLNHFKEKTVTPTEFAAGVESPIRNNLGGDPADPALSDKFESGDLTDKSSLAKSK